MSRSCIQAKILVCICWVISLIATILFTVWRSDDYRSKVMSWEYTFHGTVLWICFGFLFSNFINVMLCRERSSWKYYDIMFCIETVIMCILLMISTSILAKKTHDIRELGEIFCKIWDYDILVAVVVLAFSNLCLLAPLSFFHYKDHKANEYTDLN